LHGLVRKIDYEELLAVLKLLVMSLVLLPVLPDRGYGPWRALNPYEIWLMVVLICSISFVGYLAIRIYGEQKGVTLAAVAGGVVSSTAVTISLSRLVRQDPTQGRLIAGGITLASAMMFLRILLVLGVFGPALLWVTAVPLSLAAAAGAIAALVMIGRGSQEPRGRLLRLRNPFDFWMAARFGLILAAVMVLSRALRTWLGDPGVLLVAGLSGLADVDAITLAIARFAPEEVALDVGAAAIMLAAVANTLLKGTIALANGKRTIILPIVMGLGCQLLAIALGYGLAAGGWIPIPEF
jgi:uncharacterized membrane protein (DUF4010 family)